MAFTSTGFPAELVREVFTGAQAHSSIAKLANQIPVAFSGTDIMAFSFGGEVNLVAEAAAKASHTNSNSVINIVPLKIEYGARVSDEFLRCSDEKRLEHLRAFDEGFSKKIARGLDIMVMHGVNPKTGLAAQAIGKNSLDTNDYVTPITYTPASPKPDENIEDAVTAIGDYDLTGLAMSKTFSGALSKVKVNGVPQYPQFAWGANPDSVNGVACDVNSTVSKVDTKYAYAGDFENAFKWGYADVVNFEVIEYGDPDNTGSDLKGHNQVYLRAEAWIGWAILDGAAFARIEESDESGS